MKKVILILGIIFFAQLTSLSVEAIQENVHVYTNDNINFGLKTDGGKIITEPVYKKLIRLDDKAFIAQKGNKFGIINSSGTFIIEPKYRHAERFFGKYAKLGNNNKYGLYDKNGKEIIAHEYSKIDVLFGRMFLTCKDYKYGVTDINGKILLENKFEDIYMPSPNKMRIKYLGEWYEIERANGSEIELPDNVTRITIEDKEYQITHIISNTGIWSGYSALTITDYIVKLFSSISPAYEDTIDELMLSHGTDTVSIFMQLGWLPKFPVTYAQKYYNNLVNPINGPLSEVRSNIKKQLK